jgi:ubiquinone biosynthesis protein COQ9
MSAHMAEENRAQAVRRSLLEASLPFLAESGFSERAFKNACLQAGISLSFARRVCPHGAADLAVHYLHEGDARLLTELERRDLSQLRVREKIILAVRARLELEADRREILARTLACLSLPHQAMLGGRALYHTVDAIWRAVGDRSTDFNYYTKRALLAGIFSAMVMHWLADKPGEHDGSWVFLDRRIADIMRFEKSKGFLRRQVEGLPSPFSGLARLRYGSKTRA